MIRSMTAFARAQDTGEGANLSWEIRSVNHRYLELSPRLPDHLRELDQPVRERCRDYLARGKVELTLRASGEAAPGWRLNEQRVDELAALSRRVRAWFDIPPAGSALEVLGFSGVLVPAEHDSGQAERALDLLDEALQTLLATREREGEALRRLLHERLDSVTVQARRIRAALPGILENLRARLRRRVAEVADRVDGERLEQELALTAQKMDVEEELDRLDAHVDEAARVLNEGGVAGRRLDFLMQELNREANTLASKSVAADTSQAAVELKVLIEQMREQIQNVE